MGARHLEAQDELKGDVRERGLVVNWLGPIGVAVGRADQCAQRLRDGRGGRDPKVSWDARAAHECVCSRVESELDPRMSRPICWPSLDVAVQGRRTREEQWERQGTQDHRCPKMTNPEPAN